MAKNYVDEYADDEFEDLAEIMGQANYDNVTQTSGDSNFKPLPDGYYLCSVESALLGRNKDGQPRVLFSFKTVDNGIISIVGDDGENYLVRTPNTTNRYISKSFVINDADKLEKFASHMLKFESDEEGVPVLEKEYFQNPKILRDALGVLVGLQIYVKLTTSSKPNENGEKSQFASLVQWARANEFGLNEIE